MRLSIFALPIWANSSICDRGRLALGPDFGALFNREKGSSMELKNCVTLFSFESTPLFFEEQTVDEISRGSHRFRRFDLKGLDLESSGQECR